MNTNNIISELSLPQQKYVETIYDLCVEHGHAHSKSIAERLSIKMPSVTEALRTLSTLGLIHYEVRKAITLTDKGNAVAQMLECRHKNLATFFVEILGCEDERANKFACDIEHVIDCGLNSRVGAFLRFIEDSSESKKEVFKKFKDQYDSECVGCNNGVSGQCGSDAVK